MPRFPGPQRLPIGIHLQIVAIEDAGVATRPAAFLQRRLTRRFRLRVRIRRGFGYAVRGNARHLARGVRCRILRR